MYQMKPRELKSRLLLIDSNIRNGYFSQIDYFNHITKELEKRFSDQDLLKMHYLAPPFSVYEVLGYGKLQVKLPDFSSLVEDINVAENGSSDEAAALAKYFNAIYEHCYKSIDTDPRFYPRKLKETFKTRKKFVHSKYLKEFDSIYSSYITRSSKREQLKEFLALEVALAQDYKSLGNKFSIFLMINIGKDLIKQGHHGWYRGTVIIWEQLIKRFLEKSQHPEIALILSRITSKEIDDFNKKIRLKMKGDFLDSEAISYLLIRNKHWDDEVIFLTADDKLSTLSRVSLFKSMHSWIGESMKNYGEKLPPLKDGQIGFYSKETKSMSWVDTINIPPFLEFIMSDSYKKFIEKIAQL